MRRLSYTQNDTDRLRRSIESVGFGFLSGVVPQAALARLQIEAKERAASATLARQSTGIIYRASIAPLGPEASALLFGEQMSALLLESSSKRTLPSKDRSCVTYYHEGDHLGLHLDQPAAECTITAILYLAVRGSPASVNDTGLVLKIYGEERPIQSEPRLLIPTSIGTLVIGRGSRFWHERPKLRPGEQVTALTGCYNVARS